LIDSTICCLVREDQTVLIFKTLLSIQSTETLSREGQRFE